MLDPAVQLMRSKGQAANMANGKPNRWDSRRARSLLIWRFPAITADKGDCEPKQST